MELKNFNTYFFFGLLGIVSYGAFLFFAPFLSAIFVAALFGVMFARPYQLMVKLLHGQRAIASFALCVMIAIVIILPIVGIGSVVGSELTQVASRVRMQDSHERRTIKKIVEKALATPLGAGVLQKVQSGKIDDTISSTISTMSKKIAPLITKTYKGIVNGVIWIFVLFFSLFYFFIDGKRFIKKIMDLSPLKNSHEAMLIERFISMTRATLRSTFIIGGVQSAIGGLAFFSAGIASPMLWTVVMFFLAIIPALGAGLVIFPAGVIMITLGFLWQGIFLLVIGTIVASIDNVMRPKLIGSDVQMHSLLVFFATIGGMSVFGIIGFIVGPIIMALAIALWDIYAIEFREQLQRYNRG